MNSAARLALLVALGQIPMVQAGELGRLFFSPDERKQLDQLHAQHIISKDGSNDQSILIVNGLIQRSDGSRTAWVNGKAQHNAPGKNTNAVPVTLPGKSESIEVKVGQRLLLDNLPPTTEPHSASTKAD